MAIRTTDLASKVEPRDGYTWVSLEGTLSETSDLSALLKEIPPRVTIDLSGIRRVNSSGVLLWVAFMRDLERHGSQVVLERCSPSVVNQLNSIVGFRGSAQIRSVLAPYFCTSCEREELREIELGPGAAHQLAQPLRCPACGNPCELDDVPEHFLSFAQPVSR
jgi:anti-anti-sigma regulatory factor